MVLLSYEIEYESRMKNILKNRLLGDTDSEERKLDPRVYLWY